jgi:predicted oxidoreductase (fatty acid repression mutant protein)
MAMSTGSTSVLSALAARRSYYALRAKSPISDAKIRSILGRIMLDTPSAFNSQSTRIMVLLKQEHEKFWNIVKETLLKQIGEERFKQTGPKLDGFKAGYGTVLFYEEASVISRLKENFPLYAEHFDSWSEQTSGMHTLMAWLVLEAEGFGANLQHYNPIIDDKVAVAFSVPPTWKLRGQLVFGARDIDTPPPKDKLPLEELVRVFGSDETIQQSKNQ